VAHFEQKVHELARAQESVEQAYQLSQQESSSMEERLQNSMNATTAENKKLRSKLREAEGRITRHLQELEHFKVLSEQERQRAADGGAAVEELRRELDRKVQGLAWMEQQIKHLQERHAAAEADSKAAQKKVAKAAEDVAKANEDVAKANEDAAKANEDAAKATEEASKATKEAAKAAEDASAAMARAARSEEQARKLMRRVAEEQRRNAEMAELYINGGRTADVEDEEEVPESERKARPVAGKRWNASTAAAALSAAEMLSSLASDRENVMAELSKFDVSVHAVPEADGEEPMAFHDLSVTVPGPALSSATFPPAPGDTREIFASDTSNRGAGWGALGGGWGAPGGAAELLAAPQSLSSEGGAEPVTGSHSRSDPAGGWGSRASSPGPPMAATSPPTQALPSTRSAPGLQETRKQQWEREEARLREERLAKQREKQQAEWRARQREREARRQAEEADAVKLAQQQRLQAEAGRHEQAVQLLKAKASKLSQENHRLRRQMASATSSAEIQMGSPTQLLSPPGSLGSWPAQWRAAPADAPRISWPGSLNDTSLSYDRGTASGSERGNVNVNLNVYDTSLDEVNISSTSPITSAPTAGGRAAATNIHSGTPARGLGRSNGSSAVFRTGYRDRGNEVSLHIDAHPINRDKPAESPLSRARDKILAAKSQLEQAATQQQPRQHQRKTSSNSLQ